MVKATASQNEITVTLELTEAEAAFIMLLAGHVGGEWKYPRKHGHEIYSAISNLASQFLGNKIEDIADEYDDELDKCEIMFK